ncbi:guanitoxin biosynthesis L-enduracididine beta-hydroxylase GntD [Streptomyces sp. NBC_01233]|uniref:guanitoxin biosynthesis L-enduracididine beta-hydroxylase GntD n=1 Tax=Streptomyces sp. NBC_01233 TaxID=2903787 RepID=UPI002E0F78CD|nr:TauD/TfdA family dioxygenase [Streptomyces sp. NBC_01233]
MTTRSALPPAVDPCRFELTGTESAEIQRIIASLLPDCSSVDVGRLRAASMATRILPARLVEFLQTFRYEEPAGGCVISGWPVDDAGIGPTPMSWSSPPRPGGSLSHELYLVVLASVIGDVFAWSTVQDGNLVQDILPVPGEEGGKSAGSSSSILELHTEDAFSPLRCDYLGLMCLRNDQRVPTSYASLDAVQLSAEHRQVLAQPRFALLPDEEHVRRAAERGEQMPDASKTGLLFGDLQSPYLALDALYVEVGQDDAEAAKALETLLTGLDAVQLNVTLAPGEVLLVDNYRAVHGRGPFEARYDGRDRWLKRVSVTRDLRRSREARSGADSRVVATGLA